MSQTNLAIKEEMPWLKAADAYCREHNHSHQDFFKNGEMVCPMCVDEYSERCDCCGQQAKKRYYNEYTEQEMCRNCFEEYKNGGWNL